MSGRSTRDRGGAETLPRVNVICRLERNEQSLKDCRPAGVREPLLRGQVVASTWSVSASVTRPD